MDCTSLSKLYNLRDSINLEDVRRVLVIKLRHHGDVLLSGPVFSALKYQLPQIETDALVYLDTAPMLRNHPDVDHVWTVDRSWKQLPLSEQLKNEWRLIRNIRKRRYDLVIHLTEHWRGALISLMANPKWAVTGEYPRRSGSRVWKRAFTHTYPLIANRHTVESHLDALRRLGIRPDPAHTRLKAAPPKSAYQSARSKLLDAGLEKDEPFILIHPTSRWMFKTWPPSIWSDMIKKLAQKCSLKIVLTAAPDEREMFMVESITQSIPEVISDLAGKLSLQELLATISLAKLFIGVDSVPMHISAAVQTPGIALFGPTNESIWAPWQADVTILTSEYTCRPCGRDGCGSGKVSECLWQLSPDNVVEVAMKKLRSTIK